MKMFVVMMGLVVASAAHADAKDDQAAGMNIGLALAWRLGPETVEERCRGADPAGIDIRRKALQRWREKNSKLIQAVDERVAEVVPMLSPQEPKESVIAAVKSQIRNMILEPLSAAKSPDEVASACKTEADPKAKRWNNAGMPMVAQALAELYDWKIAKAGK
jgi:hypothetical protein